MSVCDVEVGVLEKCSNRENDIGEVRSIGLELFEDYSEEIFAAQPLMDSILAWRDSGRI